MLDFITVFNISVASILILTAFALLVALLFETHKSRTLGQYFAYCVVLALIMATWTF